MNAQLARIARDFEQATERLHRLPSLVAPELWSRRPEPDVWSVADCVDHLNRSAEAFLPRIRAALAGGGERSGRARRYRRDFVGWLLSVMMPPPVRLVKTRTAPGFEPTSPADADTLIARFDQLQREQLACLADADGLPLDRMRIRSPFDERVRYNLYSAFVILPRHQQRHIWQAEQVAEELAGRRR